MSLWKVFFFFLLFRVAFGYSIFNGWANDGVRALAYKHNFEMWVKFIVQHLE